MEPTLYARNGDVHLAYRVKGSGDVDLLFPAFGTISIDAFDEEPRLQRFVTRLASFARVILYDPRGVGLSDPIRSEAGETTEQAADDAVAVLDAVGSAQAAAFGTFGFGPAVIMLAARHPDRVSALILDNTFARLARADDHPIGMPGEILGGVLDATPDPDAGFDTDFMFEALAPSAVEDEQLKAWWEDAGRRGASPAGARLVQDGRYWADVRSELASVSAPTLVIHRRDSRYIRADHGRYLAEHIAGAHLVEMDGSDQLFFLEPAEQVLGEVEEFLTGRRTAPPVERALATVMFTDIVASTERAAALGDRQWRELLDGHDAAMRRLLNDFGGREVKTTGDGFLATFDAPGRGVECAQAACGALADLGVEIRAGVHTGEVEIRGDDIGGIAVHIGQRISGLAGAGEVVVSRTVKDLVVGSGLEFEDRGAHALKGVPDEWQVFVVVMQ